MIILDANQATMDKNLKFHLEKHTRVIVSPLDTSDLMFIGRLKKQGKIEQVRVGVELKKTPSDLLSSLRDGRLMTQLPRMTEEFDVPYLFLIGSHTKVDFETGKVQEKVRGGRWGESPFSFHYLNSIFTRFEASGGRIREVQDTNHLVATLLSILRFWRKEEHTEEVFYKKRHKYIDWRLLDNPLMEMYERMGIGIKRAGVLANEYPSLHSLVMATDKEIEELDGFGKTTVNKIRTFIEGERFSNGVHS
tara:strand:- start:3321 stop:4067 length:747 start_codon:yes stop_codon:yes gene_type:complete